jgi:hypothetical protein
LPQGDQRVLIDRRLAPLVSATIVDLRVSKAFSIGTTRIELLADAQRAQ